ncbi:MAG: BamA/TamA family outer membrane protein [Xanthomonadales bacterium]|nr:BamA/TamA family outer membrane protein [Xanthomonadales bacterium]
MKFRLAKPLIISLLILYSGVSNHVLSAAENVAPAAANPHRLTGNLAIKISGVKDDLAANIKSNLSAFGYIGERIISHRRMLTLRNNASLEIQRVLQPFGYYHPRLTIDTSTTDSGWLWKLKVDKGAAVIINEVELQIGGDGSELEDFKQWQLDWPLAEGNQLIHSSYENGKQSFGILAESLGFLDHKTITHEVHVNAKSNQATIKLHFETGPQFVFGDISFESEALQPKVLNRFKLANSGDPYTAERMDAMRKLLANSLYFKQLNIETLVDRESTPPRVNISAKPELRERDSYKATLGYGTDKGARVVLGWERHLLSSRGGRLLTGLGMQQQYSEVTFRTDYKLPISPDPGQFFIATGQYLFQNDDFSFINDNTGQSIFPAIDGPRQSLWLRAGKLSEFYPSGSSQPLSQTLFLGFLSENFDALGSSHSKAGDLIELNPELENFLDTNQTSLTLGAEWNWLSMKGSGYTNRGMHVRARALVASENAGSDISFEQIYIGNHFSILFGERLKLTLRGELGYTNAPVEELLVSDDSGEVQLSMTQLPYQFRFKAGGTYSVRGYGFESLSNNENGSNNLIAASTELEYLVGDDWSVAAFADIGNAFNNFSDIQLKAGVGIGFRYYTVVGPVRLDFAYPLDDFDNSLRIHFSLGVPILNIGKLLP